MNFLRVAVFGSFLTMFYLCPARAGEAHWPQFRGPGGRGVAEEVPAPVHISPASNVLWKVTMPTGHSSPCIWGSRIFLTALDQGKLVTLALDRKDGKMLWRKEAPAAKLEQTHRVGSPAAPTAVTDGERVYVYFGSSGLVCYDFAGAEKWAVNFPPPNIEFGTSASPILAGELVIQVRDQDMDSFLLAVDRKTGRTVWKTDRSEFRRSFATPFLWRHEAGEELVVPGGLWLKAYNLKDGVERWRMRGFSRIACASPTSGDGLLFASSWNIGGDEDDRVHMAAFDTYAAENDKDKDGVLSREEVPPSPFRDRFTIADFDKDGRVTRLEYEGLREMFAKGENALVAIRPGGKGDATATHVAWKQTRDLPYVSSPLFHRGRIYTVKNGGLVSCYDAKTGKPHFRAERVNAPGDYYASAVGAGSAIYLASENGIVTVLAATDELRILSQQKFDGQIYATPAIVEGRIYLRTTGHLYAFGL